MKNLGKMMKQAQEMQAQMAEAQKELGSLEVQGEAGAGPVRLTLTCRHEVRRINIDDSSLGDDTDMMVDVPAADFNAALCRVENHAQR